MINPIISECGKLAQKKNLKLKRTSWEKFKFDHMNKWYMHNAETVLENEMSRLLRDF